MIPLCLLLVFAGCTGGMNKDTRIRFCTYNIRGDLPRDTSTVNAWKLRRDSLCKVILSHDFDIIGMQEVKAAQLDYIREATGYEYAGSRGLFNPVFYKADRFELLHTETFWLSETMEPFSKGWDGKYDRYCTWARFRDRASGAVFYVFNVHLDHRGVEARPQGAALLCREAERISAGAPVFVCGDMNSTDTTAAYSVLSSRFRDSRKVAALVSGPEGTAHNFGAVDPIRIDYIFINDGISVDRYDVEDESYPNGMYPSDHYAVFVDAVLKQR